MAAHEVLGLFPLNVVVLPGESVALHIFEERYKRLFSDISDGSEFGIVLVEEEGLHERGCSSRLSQVTERFEDGRMNVVIQGVRRFVLLELFEPDDRETQYFRGEVEFFEDEEGEVLDDLPAKALDLYRQIIHLMDITGPQEPAGGDLLSFRLAGAIDLGTSFKQQLLETISEKRRLEMLLAAMESVMPRIKLRKERESAIRGNGKGY